MPGTAVGRARGSGIYIASAVVGFVHAGILLMLLIALVALRPLINSGGLALWFTILTGIVIVLIVVGGVRAIRGRADILVGGLLGWFVVFGVLAVSTPRPPPAWFAIGGCALPAVALFLIGLGWLAERRAPRADATRW